MKKATYLSLALTLTVAGCAVPNFGQTRVFHSGTPSIQGVVSDQSRLMITVTRERGQHIQAPGPDFDTVEFTLRNGTLLHQPATASVAMTGAGTANQVFGALRPGDGYSLDLELKADDARTGMGHVDQISLVAGETKTVAVVVGLDRRINITQSTAKNTTGSASAWYIVKGDTVVLDTGFGGISPTQATNLGIAKMRVKLSSNLYGGQEVVVTEVSGNYQTFTWNTATTTSTFTASTLTPIATPAGTITFELLNGDGAIVGRSELRNVRVLDGAGLTIEIVEGGDPG